MITIFIGCADETACNGDDKCFFNRNLVVWRDIATLPKKNNNNRLYEKESYALERRRSWYV